LLDVLFGSKLPSEDIKNEIKEYVSQMETKHLDHIKTLNQQLDRLKKQMIKEKSKVTNSVVEKSELE